MMEEIIINLICVGLTLGSLGVAAWALLSGDVMGQGLDGIFLLLICLLTALTFSLYPLKAVRQGRLGELLKRGRSKAKG